MIRKLKSSIGGHVRVIFELPASVWADRIYLTGDFNHWNERDLPLRQERDGVWRVALDLPAGQRFQFRYLVDGQWQTDWHSDGSEQNRYGSQNSVIFTELPEAESKVEHAQTGSLLREERSELMLPVDASNPVRYPLLFGPTVENVKRVQARPAA